MKVVIHLKEGHRSLCGFSGANALTYGEPSEVTCQRCLRRMASKPDPIDIETVKVAVSRADIDRMLEAIQSAQWTTLPSNPTLVVGQYLRLCLAQDQREVGH